MTGSSAHENRRVDLHVHTDASDGLYAPSQVVRLAQEAGLAAVAIADHDTVAGFPEALAAGHVFGVEVIPGVELTAYAGRAEIHITGLFIDSCIKETIARIDEMRDVRRVRMRRMVEKLHGLGVEIDAGEVLAEVPDGSVGRPHLAKVLVEHGYASDTNEAFARFLGNNGPVYVRKKELTVAEAIGIVRDLGGLPVLAHPGVSRSDERIPEFVEAGLAGLEVWHTKHSHAQERHYARLAEKHGLVPSGGSDFHGPGRTEAILGVPEIGYEVLDALRERHAATSTTEARRHGERRE